MLGIGQVAFDGDRLVVGGNVFVATYDLRSAATSDDVRTPFDGASARAVSYRPDGTVVAASGTYTGYSQKAAIAVWDPSGPERTPTLRIPTSASDMDVSADGSLVAVVDNGVEALSVADVASGSFRRVDAPGVLTAQVVAFSPDGKLLAVAGGNQGGSAIDWFSVPNFDLIGTTDLGDSITPGVELLTDLAFADDSTRLVVGQFAGTPVVVDARTRQIVPGATRILLSNSVALHGSTVYAGELFGNVERADLDHPDVQQPHVATLGYIVNGMAVTATARPSTPRTPTAAW